MKTSLDHLPDSKRRELQHVVAVLFAEFEDATKAKQIATRKMGRILKIVLFGSYARGDWVEDRASGYRSDYDLLVVVNQEELTDLVEYWGEADEHLLRDYETTHRLTAPANFIVHSLAEVNDQLARGRPFFSDIVRDGVILYEAPDHPFATPEPLSPEAARAEAERYFGEWLPKARSAQKLAAFAIQEQESNDAAFLLHQATERLYHALLLTLTLYSPKSHRLNFLRAQAERLDPRLIEAWPRAQRFEKRCWELLRRAYVDARYSSQYHVTDAELAWLAERFDVLAKLVERAGKERLAR